MPRSPSMQGMAEVAKKERGHAVKIKPWVLHDLRRSFLPAGLQHIGIAPQIIERALNHSSGTFGGIGRCLSA